MTGNTGEPLEPSACRLEQLRLRAEEDAERLRLRERAIPRKQRLTPLQGMFACIRRVGQPILASSKRRRQQYAVQSGEQHV